MKTKALDRVSVELPLKSSISIVGRNGSGKSTLIKLLLRLYQPDEGRIFLDGVDIWTIPLEKYRQQVTAVFQDYYIFALDIRENITVTGQDDDKVWEALRKAGVAAAGFDHVSFSPVHLGLCEPSGQRSGGWEADGFYYPDSIPAVAWQSVAQSNGSLA